MMRFISIALTALFAAAVPAWAQEEGSDVHEDTDLHLGVTNKMDYRRFDQDNIRADAFRNRLEVTAVRGPFDLWVRLEALTESDAFIYDPFGLFPEGVAPNTRYDETEVTKRAFTFKQESFRATVGDGSMIYGRGMLLALFEDEELNFDNRPEGLFARFENDLGRAQAIGASKDHNRFRGVLLEPNAWGPLRLGAGFVEMWGSGVDTFIQDREQDYGGLAELVYGPATVYGEYVHREFPNAAPGAGDAGEGGGGFVSGLIASHGFSLSGEYRDYSNFEHQFHDPPTALKQHTWTLLNRINGQVQQDINDNDAEGFLMEGSYSAGLFTSVTSSYSEVRKDVGRDEFWEVFGEGKTHWKERMFFTAAAAESEFKVGTVFEENIGVFGEIVGELNEIESLTANVEWNDVRESDSITQAFQEPIDFSDRVFSLSYGRSPWLSLTASYEETTDPREEDQKFFSGVAEINIVQNHDLVVTYGKERGGWKCSGGVCFFEPEFEGLKLRWVARY
jgi:hypothetical protein